MTSVSPALPPPTMAIDFVIVLSVTVSLCAPTSIDIDSTADDGPVTVFVPEPEKPAMTAAAVSVIVSPVSLSTVLPAVSETVRLFVNPAPAV